MNPVNKMFDNMDNWRHLPAYQLERRADIFFSIYMPEVLQVNYGKEIEGIIPEFPVRVGTIYDNAINKSFKIDYLAKVKDSNRVFFVELKTDQSSRRLAQDDYLERAKQAGMMELLEGLRQIYKATNSKKKYGHLLNQLERLGLIHLKGSGVFKINPGEYFIDIIYIQPHNLFGQKNVISFNDFSEIVKNYGDEVSLRFAESLRRWADTKAGEVENAAI